MAQTVKRLSTMQETGVQSLGGEDPLETDMAIHSSTIAWKIPRTEKPGRLQSMGSQRVRNDCDFTFTFHLQIVSDVQQVKSLAQGKTSYKWQSCDLSSSNMTKAFLSFNPS